MNINMKTSFSNIFDHILLKALEIIALIAQWGCIVGAVAALLVSAILLIISLGPEKAIQQEILHDMGSSISLSEVIIILIVGFLILLTLTLTMHYFYELIKNIYAKKFFTARNLKSIRNILWALFLGSVIQWGTNSILSAQGLEKVSDVFSLSFLGNPLMLAAIYVIYLIFKYGLALQEDSDKVI